MKRSKLITFLFFLSILMISHCGVYSNKGNPNLISYSEALTKIRLATIAKCSESGGNFGNIATAESFVSLVFSGANTISTPDKADLYYKRSNVTNCITSIMLYAPPSVCDFNDLAALDLVSNKKLCNLKPDRSIKLNIISTK
ncbi:MAG: hypothetical protein H7A24_16175 [Leptospiraceae bacterium]|nr:hypothetical protein [Leptospiraceae bacterium]MCP5513425.1 hypothetical protein [Leptospiraceae bacterium]